MKRSPLVAMSAGVYGTLAILALGWCAWKGRPGLVGHPEPWLALPAWGAHLGSLALGVTVAVITVVGTRLLVARSSRMARLHLGFRELVGDLDGGSILFLALASGIGEELFFRAALQPSVGWVIASVIFGVVHVAPDRRFFLWTAWAMVMGFVLGAIYESTGSLLGCVVAHIAINHENLHFIVRHDPRGPQETEQPPIVDRVERS